jgi:uncharacterized CHY-type Zn-finger protein
MRLAPVFPLLLALGGPLLALAAEPADDDEERVVLSFKGYPDAPPFTVAPPDRRIRKCTRCHAKMDPNPTVRILEDAPHVEALNHGNGRIWCLDCHDEKDRDHLHDQLGKEVEFTQSYLVCGGCHANRQKDWYFGGHGKRKTNWMGKRVIYNCTHCHDPHEPAIQPRRPKPIPPVRAGLPRMKAHGHVPESLWPWKIAADTEVHHE